MPPVVGNQKSFGIIGGQIDKPLKNGRSQVWQTTFNDTHWQLNLSVSSSTFTNSYMIEARFFYTTEKTTDKWAGP